MTRNRVFLILQAIVCILLVLMLCASAVSAYREGLARRADDPRQQIFTAEIAAERLGRVAPLFFIGVGLLIAGLVLDVKNEGAKGGAKDSELTRDLVVRRVANPSEAMKRARAAQKRLLYIGWGVFALCMVPVAVYIADAAHFPQEDLEGMFYALLRVLLPFGAVGLGALAVTSVLRERHVLLEIEAAQARIKEERGGNAAAKPDATASGKGRTALQAIVVVVAAALIVMGALNGGARDVLVKAITICTECVGLG